MGRVSRGCTSKHTDAAAPHCLSHSRQHQPLTHPHNTPKGARAALTPPSEPWRKPLTHFGSFRAGRLLRPLMGALRPAQPQRVAPLTYWPRLGLWRLEAGMGRAVVSSKVKPSTPLLILQRPAGKRPAAAVRGQRGLGGKRRRGVLCQQMEQLIREDIKTRRHADGI